MSSVLFLHNYLCNGKVKGNDGKAIWLWDSERGVQASNEVRHLVERDELRRVRVEPGHQYCRDFHDGCKSDEIDYLANVVDEGKV